MIEFNDNELAEHYQYFNNLNPNVEGVTEQDLLLAHEIWLSNF